MRPGVHPFPRRAGPAPRRRRGVATLLMIVLIALGLAAASAMTAWAMQGSLRLQQAEHTVTQAEMNAWNGVVLLSRAVAAMPASTALTSGGRVNFGGASSGLAATLVGKTDGLYVFDVVGASAGARSVVRVAIRPPASSGGGKETALPGGATFHGNTRLDGSVNYTGSEARNLYVLDGSLTLNGSVSGLQQVCATGDITVDAAISVEELCSNGNITLGGAATVKTITAKGNVTLAGGAASAVGSIVSNGTVTLSGGSASAGSIRARGKVTVSGSAARATEIYTEDSIDWTSTATATTLAANGTVNYRPSGTGVATDISAIGNVTLTSARNVRTGGSTVLVGYWGQGISGRLDGAGLLSGSSWGAYGGAVVASGSVGSIVSPYPGTVRVTVTPGHTVVINPVTVETVATFERPRITVDAYALRQQANFAFLGVDASGNPRVQVAQINGLDDGSYYVAANASGGRNYLCKAVSGNSCVTPLMKICQGYSDYNNCLDYTSGRWTLQGTTMLPGVLWFAGDLTISNGNWVNTFLATGDIGTAGGVKVYAPNYIGSAYACQGQASSGQGLNSWTGYGFARNAYARQLCTGSPAVLSSASIGNVALLSGGLKDDGSFVGGNIALGASNEIYGSVLAGQYLNTSGSTLVAGSTYSAAQGGSKTATSNRETGSTTIKLGGGSSAYDPDITPCTANCGSGASADNVVWAAPI